MPNVIGVRFRPVTKVYHFDPHRFNELKIDDRVIVETARGLEMGTVVTDVRQIDKNEVKGKLKRVIRQATSVDLIQAEEYRSLEPYAIEKCNELVWKMQVPIKIIQADYSFDGSRLLFAFVSEQRVDFRDLVKELARSLKTRIEMKQVGARDETKLLDGYGRCGRRLCCSSWLTEFHPVSIRMAKHQGLPLAPSEISGLCGRLLCCLAYEDAYYTEMRKVLPRVNSQVKTEDGFIGTVRGVNVIKETLILNIEEKDTPYVEVEASTVEPLASKPKQRSKSRSKSKSKPQSESQPQDKKE
ncbi:MAG: regulatory iron-sulfur-containing complex subunit RicT [Chloroflexota bacterium]